MHHIKALWAENSIVRMCFAAGYLLQASDDEGLSDRDIDEAASSSETSRHKRHTIRCFKPPTKVMSRPVGMSPPRFVYLRIMVSALNQQHLSGSMLGGVGV